MGLTALLYNWGFFTVLGFARVPMHLDTHQLGISLHPAGECLSRSFAVFAATPGLQARFGIAPTLYVNLVLFAGRHRRHRPVREQPRRCSSGGSSPPGCLSASTIRLPPRP